jgi:hypothetical protein
VIEGAEVCLSWHDCVVWPLHVGLPGVPLAVHAQLVAAGLQLALSVIALPNVPDAGPLTVHAGTAVTTQFRTLAPAGPVSVKSLQFGSLRVRVACANAPAEVKASAAVVHASAAQRISDRFISDSQAKRRSGGPMAPASSAPSNCNENN